MERSEALARFRHIVGLVRRQRQLIERLDGKDPRLIRRAQAQLALFERTMMVIARAARGRAPFEGLDTGP